MAIKICFIIIFVFFSFETLKCQGRILNPYFEDISLDFVNYSYVDRDTFDISINYKPKAMNSINVKIDLIEDLPADVKIKLDASSRILGQEIPTGLSFHTSICDDSAKYFYETIAIPFGAKGCPPEKGSYEKEDFIPDLAAIPIPWIPGASLLVRIQLYAGDIQLIDFKAFLVV